MLKNPPSKMNDLGILGKWLAYTGLVLIGCGGLIILMSKGVRGFRLPGDISIQRGNWSFFFPVVTCILISVVLTILLNMLRLFRR